MACHFTAVCEVVSRPDSSQSGRLRHSSGSLVDFRGRRAAVFLLCPLMCEIWAFRYFWPRGETSSDEAARPAQK
jgi:hypothetical protein